MKTIGALLIAYALASLLHFAHNAAYAHAYPNLPAALTAPVVMAVWTGQALLGLAGWILLRRGRAVVGLAAIALWAALGFDGLGHYALAPMRAHTRAMNLSIGLELVAAAALLAAAGWSLAAHARAAPAPRFSSRRLPRGP